MCKYLVYVEHLLVLVSAVTVCVSISSLVCVPVGITSSEVVLKICAVTAGIKSIRQLSRKRKKCMIK